MYVYKSVGFGLKKSSIETEPKYFDFLKFKPKPNQTEPKNWTRFGRFQPVFLIHRFFAHPYPWLPDKSEWKDLISQEEKHRWVQSKKSSNNGVLSIKSAYKAMAYARPHRIISEIRSNIWKKNLPVRLKMLLWRIASNDLLTRERQSKFMTIDNTSCLLCNIGAIKSSLHLLQ